MAQDGKQNPGTTLDSPKQYSFPDDARNLTNAGKYPNSWSRKTRSGHAEIWDDSQGAEHVTIQHRTGSMVQFMPDGAVVIRAHKGKYTLTLGEDRVEITGSSDVHVKGGATLLIDRNYDVTVHGDMEYHVDGKIKMTAKRFEQLIEEDIDIEAKNRTEKIKENISQTAQGSQYIAAQNGGITVSATKDTVAIGAGKDVGISAGNKLMTRSVDKTSIVSALGDIEAKAFGELGLQTQQGSILMKAQGGDVGIQTDHNMSMKAENFSIEASGGTGSLHASSTMYVLGDTATQINNGSADLTPDDPGEPDNAKTDTKITSGSG